MMMIIVVTLVTCIEFLMQVRCDSGITEGSEISIYYDPMICKVIH